MEGTGGEGSKSKDLKESPAAAAAPETKKGPWTAEEDAILIEHVRRNGEGNWNSVQRTSGLLRCGKSCRLRWANHLRPNLKKGQLTPEEELLVLRLHAQLGNKWARMAAQLPGRTDNEIKNYWNTRVKRRQRAGLPLYPPGILQRHRPPPLLIPSGGAAAAAVPPLSSSPPVFSSPMMMPSAMAFSPSSSALRQLAEAPRAAKRARDDDGTTTMFRFPVSPLPSVVPRMWHTAPSTPTGTTMLDYSMVPPMTPPMAPSAYSAGTEMLARSSSCHVLDGSGGVELMDKLLQEAERAEQKEERDRAFDWADPFGSFDEGKESVVGGAAAAAAEAFMGLEELHSSSNGEPAPPTNYSESNQLPTTNASAATNTTGISVSGLLEMIPTQPAAPAAAATTDWNNNSEGSDVSNGGQSAVTNDDLAVDLHQLASSLPDAQMEPDWTMSSCHWNNLPELM